MSYKKNARLLWVILNFMMKNPVNLGLNFNPSHHLYPYLMYVPSVNFSKTVDWQAGLHFGCLPVQSVPKSNTGHDGCVQAFIHECNL